MPPRPNRVKTTVGVIAHTVLVLAGALALTLAFFLVLPLIQAIGQGPTESALIRSLDTAVLPPPPPPPEEEPPEEEEQEEEPPELMEEAPPLDLSQLELALNPGFGGDYLAGDFTVNLNSAGNDREEVDALFSMSDLDQRPRAIHQPPPNLSPGLRRRTPAQVVVIFVVDRDGRVQNPIVQNSSDPRFERPALAALRQWKFEPGKRNGEPVQFRMRVPITFPKSR